MPVFYKGERVPWTIPGMDPKESIRLDPATFNPDILPQGRIDAGTKLIRIPTVPNRISTRSDGYIELILERHYDPEAKQSRNKKIIIGSDASGFLPGMMVPNDNYNNLFDGNGRLYRDPMKEEELKEEPKQKPKEQPEPIPEAQPETKATDSEPAASKAKEHPGKDRETALDQRETAIMVKEAKLKYKEQQLLDQEKELEKIQDQMMMKANEAEKDHIRLLSYILESYIDTVQAQAKRKPDAPMSAGQIRTINEILSELKDFFAGSESEAYLHLAEEPDDQTNTPGTTRGEMALLLTPYQYTVATYLSGGLRKKQKP